MATSGRDAPELSGLQQLYVIVVEVDGEWRMVCTSGILARFGQQSDAETAALQVRARAQARGHACTALLQTADGQGLALTDRDES